MPKRTLTLAAAAAFLLLVAAQAFGSPAAAKQNCGGAPNPSLHWNAVFGHATSIWQATLLRRRVQASGFAGLQFRKDYCDDVEVIVPGADTSAIRTQLVQEADQVHVPISFEPPDILKRPDQDVAKAVFGTKPTLSRANKLQQDIAHVGFREGTDIERLALHSWRVVLYNVPVKDQQNFAAEAASVGYRVTFIPQ